MQCGERANETSGLQGGSQDHDHTLQERQGSAGVPTNQCLHLKWNEC